MRSDHFPDDDPMLPATGAGGLEPIRLALIVLLIFAGILGVALVT